KLETDVAIDEPAVMIAWPLPSDPMLRTQIRALAPAAAAAVDSEIKGLAMRRELGDDRAPLLAVIAVPGKNETIDQLISGAKHGLDALPMVFGRKLFALDEITFDSVQQTAIYDQYSELEDSEARDARIAGYVLAGHDPNQVLGAEFAGVRELTGRDASAL